MPFTLVICGEPLEALTRVIADNPFLEMLVPRTKTSPMTRSTTMTCDYARLYIASSLTSSKGASFWSLCVLILEICFLRTQWAPMNRSSDNNALQFPERARMPSRFITTWSGFTVRNLNISSPLVLGLVTNASVSRSSSPRSIFRLHRRANLHLLYPTSQKSASRRELFIARFIWF